MSPSRSIRWSTASAFAAACLIAQRCAAQSASTCGTDGTAPCTLQHTLDLLYILAAVLGVILLAVIGAAIYFYRKNKNVDLKPE